MTVHGPHRFRLAGCMEVQITARYEKNKGEAPPLSEQLHPDLRVYLRSGGGDVPLS
jgi:hypothetical protein